MSKQAYTCVFQYNPGSVGLTQAHPNYCECILETTASLPPTSGKYLLHPATSFVLEQSESNPISLWMKVEHLSRYLFAGDGKTHYIIERLKCIPQYHQLIIAVNETFTYMMLSNSTHSHIFGDLPFCTLAENANQRIAL